MAAVASEPGAAAAASVSLSAAEPGPADLSLDPRDLPPLPPGLCDPALGSKEHEERRQDRDKSGVSNQANEELMLMLQDCTEANAELMLQDSLPPSDPVQAAVSPLSLPAALEAPEAPEGGLSLGQPNGPARACTDRSQRRSSGGPELCTSSPEPGPPGPPETESSPELRPGTHVRVSLDHVIDDALVVSFRVGNKVFSGVLMDLTHRFGPYGIPITVFPPRRESSRRHVQTTPPPAEAPPPPAAEAPPPDPALTPLFHQGAPYPPPLFLRDSYHTSLPQPPPRRIKRSRRRYGNSEEPTCMLVRLRPRQVLCDRCKGAAGPRAPPVSSRRRCAPDPPEENLSAEVKRLRCDDRPPRPRREGPKAGGVASTTLRRLDHRENRDSSHRDSPAPRDRSSTPSTRQGGVLTRRLNSALTPPRIRLKPHRYRTETEEQAKTRPGTRPGSRPGLRPGPGSQRSRGNNGREVKITARNQGRNQTKPGSRPGSRPETRPGTRPGTKAEARPGTRPGSRPETRPESRTKPRPDPEPAQKKETKPRILKADSDQARADSQSPCRPEPRPDLRPEPRPDLRPDPRPEQASPSRSRRKQVFPRPTRDFDLDFMGWAGPEPDLDRDLEQTGAGLNPGRAESPKPDPDQDLDSGPGLETKPEPDFKREPTELEVQAWPSPKPDPGLKAEIADRSPDPDPSPSPDPRPDPSPDPVLTESTERPPSQRSLRSRSRSGSRSRLDSRASSPASSSSASSRSRTSERSRSESRPQTESRTRSKSESKSEHEQGDANGSRTSERPRPDSGPDPGPDLSPDPSPDLPESQSSTRSKSDPKPRPEPETNSVKVSESLKAGPKLDPKPDSKPDLRPDPIPDCRPDPRAVQGSVQTQSRSVQRLLGADGRRVAVGDIVWAKIAGFPWWPARVLQLSVCRRGDREGGGVKQEARVAWFGSRTTSLLPLSSTSPFLETFQTRFDRKRKGPYRRAIAEAANAAKQTPTHAHNT